MAKSKGHTVIRLPPYHCQYNAIEMIWAQIKGCAARLNTTPPFTANKMMTLLEKCCSEVTPDNWRKVVEKTKKLCYDDWDRDVRYDTLEDQPLLINVGDSSCSSDSESETQTLMSLSDSE
ncbi:uncharacterized protein LOC123665298 [Melitaea cinxia]|uniref:uncharacterized protein LOC123658511 n=1 Tax=Melitaea cinxia TaxID=113334 RepID=UPI001E26F8A6|nr:uncharacterized protein LOC123658511 [Melitaea cinxia]XP_045455575.1 uncharacterized protein LOC123665298 [Melitaea cinxia]